MAIIVNPIVNALEAYVPGEQPREAGYVKLNTNESPYPPAPDVIAAVREAAAEGAFNKYPDPASMSLRDAIAERIQVPVSQILVGNGSDEVLRLVCHAFLRPGTDDCIGMVYPTYVLYRTLAAMFGAGCFAFEVSGPDYAIPDDAYLSPARVFFLANPNPPLGTRYARAEVARLAAADPDRLLVVDEAYVDFSEGDMMEVFREFSNVAITRTFSKSYSLAGMRVGFIVAREPLISQLEKIKDSYNLNRVSQVAAEAAWKAISYYDEKSGLICENRGFLAEELQIRGFEVPASSGNFVFARRRDAAELYRKLKEQRILVRYFDAPALRDGLRITVGTRPELNALLSALDTM